MKIHVPLNQKMETFQLINFHILALILWNDVEPSKDWVEGQVPPTIRRYCMVKPCHSLDIDYEAMK